MRSSVPNLRMSSNSFLDIWHEPLPPKPGRTTNFGLSSAKTSIAALSESIGTEASAHVNVDDSAYGQVHQNFLEVQTISINKLNLTSEKEVYV
ncbi:hypothetical protein KSF78_0000733 [Schistosoma japonicum]|nr:hypothetical protein KSF78_0000733 [Schistosoma japonicum]